MKSKEEIRELANKYLEKDTKSNRTLSEEYFSLIKRISIDLRYVRKTIDIEKYLTILHLIVIGNNSSSTDEKDTYLRLGETLYNTIDERLKSEVDQI